MEYGFRELQGTEIFYGKSGLNGEQCIVENYEDETITHKFTIDGIIKTAGGKAWYSIKNHSTVVDKSVGLQKKLDEQSDAICELAELIGG